MEKAGVRVGPARSATGFAAAARWLGAQTAVCPGAAGLMRRRLSHMATSGRRGTVAMVHPGLSAKPKTFQVTIHHMNLTRNTVTVAGRPWAKYKYSSDY